MAAFQMRGGGGGGSCPLSLLLLQLLLLVAVLQVKPSVASIRCEGHSLQECAQQTGSWTSLWYVWLIMLTVFLLLMCGIGASCVKFCCRKKRPPVQNFPPQGHDLTAIPMDHDSTAHSTVTSYSSVQYPQSILLPLSFREIDRSLMNPPAYSLYAIELPPSYDEAIKMAKPCIETPMSGQKPDKNASPPVAGDEPNQPPSVVADEPNQPPSVVADEPNQPPSVVADEPNQPPSVVADEPNQPPSVVADEPNQPPSVVADEPNQPSSVAAVVPNQLPTVAADELNQPPSVAVDAPNQPPSVAADVLNHPQTLPEMSSSSPETVRPDPQLPEVSTQGQPEL